MSEKYILPAISLKKSLEITDFFNGIPNNVNLYKCCEEKIHEQNKKIE